MFFTALKRTFFISIRAAACSSILIGMVGCGGGGGGGEDDGIAPLSLEDVTLTIENAFTLEFNRLSGTAGNESGAVNYIQTLRQFFYSTPSDGSLGGGIGFFIYLPEDLSDISYDYVKTGPDTGRITVSYDVIEVYPPEIGDNPKKELDYNSEGDMFWGGRELTANALIIDVIFSSADDTEITGSSTTLRSAYIYSSTYDSGSDQTTYFAEPLVIRTREADYRLSSSDLPARYNPYTAGFSDQPSAVVWESLGERVATFAGTDGVDRVFSFLVSDSGTKPQIADVATIEETGTFGVDVYANDGATVVEENTQGSYSYARTGGNEAKLAIEYGSTSITYTMQFEATDSGSYQGSNGISGEFTEDLYQIEVN